jgi:hypothetical protein
MPNKEDAMFNLNDYALQELARQRQEELLREAEIERLVRDLRKDLPLPERARAVIAPLAQFAVAVSVVILVLLAL